METSKWEGTKKKVNIIPVFGSMYTYHSVIPNSSYPYVALTPGEQQANARLFTDALHTIQECGIIPSEFVKQLAIERHDGRYSDLTNELNQLREENAKLKAIIEKLKNTPEYQNWLKTLL